jgi:peptidoglycan/LPS O-acetylase OafA/YrhL
MSKPHFDVLDGLRGTAALVVVLFHFSEWLAPNQRANPLGHAFLAVDFFFCLSGFVIGYAYDLRRTMRPGEFLQARLIRLHPLVVLGCTAGLLSFLFDPFDGAVAPIDALPVWIAFLAGLFLVPLACLGQEREFLLFPLNAPAWSLFWEYVANLVYALVLWRLPRRALAVLVALAAIVLAGTAFDSGSIDGGWWASNWWRGAPRTAFSFLAGLAVWRYRAIRPTRLGYLSLSGLLAAALMAPWPALNWLMESGLVILLFPMIVAMGAGAQVSGWRARVCRFMGRISYPLYITHNMVIWPFGHYVHRYAPKPWQITLTVGALTLFAVGFAYVAVRWFDEPVRAWLARRWASSSTASGVSVTTG